MGSSTQDRIVEKAAPFLERGERIELACFVAVGSVSYRKEFVRALIIGLITLVLTAGMGWLITMKRPRKAHLALTDRRLLIFDGEASFGTSKPGKLLYRIPRQAVTVVKSGNWGLGILRMELAIAGQDRNLRLSFTSRFREDGHAVIAKLGNQHPRTPADPRDGYSRQSETPRRHPRPDDWEAQPGQRQGGYRPQPERGGYQDWPGAGQRPAQQWDDRRQPQRGYQQAALGWDDRRQPSGRQPTFQPQQQWPAGQAQPPRGGRRPGQDGDRHPQPEWDPYRDRPASGNRDYRN